MSEPDRLVSIADVDRMFAAMKRPVGVDIGTELRRRPEVVTWLIREEPATDIGTVSIGPVQIDVSPPRPRSGAREAARRRRQMEKARR